MFKKLLQRAASFAVEPLRADIQSLRSDSRQQQILLFLEYARETRERGHALSFDDIGFNVFSSTNEDGILLYIMSLIGFSTRTCVDIGAGGIAGSNSANLIVNHGFGGVLVDGDSLALESWGAFSARRPNAVAAPVGLACSIVTAENVNELLTSHGVRGVVDLLSIDVDGVDYWIWKSIDVIEPRVVLVEYQDILGPDREWTIPYKPDFRCRDYSVNQDLNNYCGASLAAFVKLGKTRGYRLVGCNTGGWNAFFVRDGFGEDLLPEIHPAACFRYTWNHRGVKERFPLVQDMPWEKV